MGVNSATLEMWTKPKWLNHDEVALLWALEKGEIVDNDAERFYREKLAWAVFNEQINAQSITLIEPFTNNNVSYSIAAISNDKGGIIRKAIDAWYCNERSVTILLEREAVFKWLTETKQLPLNEGCELNRWFGCGHQFETETQYESVKKDAVLGNCRGMAKKSGRQRKDNLRRAIEAAVKHFPEKPSLDELMQYFQNERDETGFIEDYDDQKIVWRDTRGMLQSTPIRNLANRLARIKF